MWSNGNEGKRRETDPLPNPLYSKGKWSAEFLWNNHCSVSGQLALTVGIVSSMVGSLLERQASGDIMGCSTSALDERFAGRFPQFMVSLYIIRISSLPFVRAWRYCTFPRARGTICLTSLPVNSHSPWRSTNSQCCDSRSELKRCNRMHLVRE